MSIRRRRISKFLVLFAALFALHGVLFFVVAKFATLLMKSSRSDVTQGYTETASETLPDGTTVYLLDADAKGTFVKIPASCSNGLQTVTFGRVGSTASDEPFQELLLNRTRGEDASRTISHWRVGFCGFLPASSMHDDDDAAAADAVTTSSSSGNSSSSSPPSVPLLDDESTNENVAWIVFYDMSQATGKDALFRFDLACCRTDGDQEDDDDETERQGRRRGDPKGDETTTTTTASKFYRFYRRGDGSAVAAASVGTAAADEGGSSKSHVADSSSTPSPSKCPGPPTVRATAEPMWRTCESPYERYLFASLWHDSSWKVPLAAFAVCSVLLAALIACPLERHLRRWRIMASRWTEKATEAKTSWTSRVLPTTTRSTAATKPAQQQSGRPKPRSPLLQDAQSSSSSSSSSPPPLPPPPQFITWP